MTPGRGGGVGIWCYDLASCLSDRFVVDSSLAGGTIGGYQDVPRAPNCESKSIIARNEAGTFVAALPCGSWRCLRCAARMTSVWARRVAEAEPERFCTFTSIGLTRDEIRVGMQRVVRGFRERGLKFEYWGVVELHRSGVPHMHCVQHGSFIPRPVFQQVVRGAGWGHPDIRRCSEGWSAARYCAKHLCHSHGRRWDGRLIRYSRHFFARTRRQEREERRDINTRWEVVHGRADQIARRLEREGEEVFCQELGIDWIMGEVRVGDHVEVGYARDERKGYLTPPLVPLEHRRRMRD